MNLLEVFRNPTRTSWQVKNYLQMNRTVYDLACETVSKRIALQRKWELIAYLNLVARLRPVTILEIGTYQGGNLRCMSAVCPDKAHFISLDLPGGTFGGGYSAEDAVRFKQQLKPNQSLDCLRMDSHSPEARDSVASILNGKKLDLLFIDGDHSEAGVREDFLNFAPFVRTGGLIAFHDIVPHKVHASCQVHAFWAQLKSVMNVVEIIDRDGFDDWGGIGVVYVPESGMSDILSKVRLEATPN